MSEIINGANMNKSGVYPGWKAGSAGGAGGVQSVEVTPIVEEGTKIASIAVDGDSTDLYAPAGGGEGEGFDLLVTITADVSDPLFPSYTSDKTYDEILSAVNTGKKVYAQIKTNAEQYAGVYPMNVRAWSEDDVNYALYFNAMIFYPLAMDQTHTEYITEIGVMGYNLMWESAEANIMANNMYSIIQAEPYS